MIENNWRKESLSSDGQQFYQYFHQQNERTPLNSNIWNKIILKMTIEIKVMTWDMH